MASATEAETGALFLNTQDGAAIRTTLGEYGFPQPATLVETDNACATGIANNTMKQKRSKAMDMRFHWVRDRVEQKQFIIYWRKGQDNLADYYTKHHPPSHHKEKRSTYLHTANTARHSTGEGVLIRHKSRIESRARARKPTLHEAGLAHTFSVRCF
jgi:hypothetical protein